MRALAFGDFGEAPSVIETPTPEITAPDEVLVAVKAASLNRFDAMVAAGFLQGMLEHQFPVTLGRDFSGVVEAVGDGVTEFKVGDAVFGMIGNMVLGNGSLADRVVVSEQHLAHKPEVIGYTDAAALPLAGSTAIAAVDWVEAGPGKVVLIVGATGGVGSYAIQLAHARGATVIATGLTSDEETLRGFGADEVLDYQGDLAATLKGSHPDGVDGLIDLASDGPALSALTDVVVDSGRVASALSAADVDALADRDIAATNLVTYPNAETFAALAGYVADGTLEIPVTDVYRLDDSADGLGRFLGGSVRGKMAVSLE
jgi:NADPH:quinone reductase-like Zn-dependent oxidoreductase